MRADVPAVEQVDAAALEHVVEHRQPRHARCRVVVVDHGDRAPGAVVGQVGGELLQPVGPVPQHVGEVDPQHQADLGAGVAQGDEHQGVGGDEPQPVRHQRDQVARLGDDDARGVASHGPDAAGAR